MPLTPTTSFPSTLLPQLRERATPDKPSFLIVYASLSNGRSWCGDCRAAEPLLNEKFAGEDKEGVFIAYAGVKDEWKKGDNVWRRAPFFVVALPTLVKVGSDGGLDRLVEEDVYDQVKLDAFVGR